MSAVCKKTQLITSVLDLFPKCKFRSNTQKCVNVVYYHHPVKGGKNGSLQWIKKKKSFKKIQQPYMINSLSKLGMERSTLGALLP